MDFTLPTNERWSVIRQKAKDNFEYLDTKLIAGVADVKDYGAVGDGVADDYAAIQAVIDDTDIQIVRIGSSLSDVFLISQPLIGKSNLTLLIGGYVKIKNGTTTTLTQNVTAGDTRIYVTSVSGFNVGEQISITDNILPTQGGSSPPQTRRVAASGVISAVGTNYIDILLGSQYNVSMADGGRLGHTQSVFVFDAVDNITFNCTGTLDDNWQNQMDCEPVRTTVLPRSGEDVSHGCCLSIYGCENVDIYVREAKNSLLHNISVFGNASEYCKNINISGWCHDSHDKNLLLGYINTAQISNYVGENAIWEDGLICYAHCYNITMNQILVINNDRNGITISGGSTENISVSNVVTFNNRSFGLTVAAKNVNVANVISTDAGRLIGAFYDCFNINISNWTFSDVTSGRILHMYGYLSRVNISNLIMNNCDGIAIYTAATSPSGAPLPPDNVNIIGGGIYNHTGATTDLAAGTDIVFTAFRNL